MEALLSEISINPVIKLVCLTLLADAIFGVLRAIKSHELNSSFGINGLLRKCGIILAVLFLFIADTITNIDLMPFITADTLQYISLTSIGLTEACGILFIAFETLSILKNMMILGLPLPKGLKSKLETWLKNNSEEMGTNNEKNQGR